MMLIIKYIFTIVLITTSIMAGSCYSASIKKTSSEYQCKYWVKNFFTFPRKDQAALFENYDLETQYAIYICGNQIIHPPAMHLAIPFAMRGEDAVILLSSKLKKAEDDFTIRDIIYVFPLMQLLETYDVLSDNALMNLIIESMERMENEGWKELLKKEVNEKLLKRDV